MAPVEMHAEVLLAAFGIYALIVLGLTLWNARRARRSSSRLDEVRPQGHALNEPCPQALVSQIFGRDQ